VGNRDEVDGKGREKVGVSESGEGVVKEGRVAGGDGKKEERRDLAGLCTCAHHPIFIIPPRHSTPRTLTGQTQTIALS